MRSAAAVSLVLLLAAAAGAAPEAGPVSWPHEGYRSLLDAAAAARPDGRRLLVGLAGSPT